MGKKLKKMALLAITAMVIVISQALVTRGDEIGDLKRQMAEQSKILQEMQQKLEKLEAQQGLQNKTILDLAEGQTSKEEIKKMAEVPDSLKWAENVKLYGDFRYRHESIDQESSGTQRPGINHNRIRARLGVDAKVTDEVGVGFRLATGSDSNPNTTNQTLDNGFTKKSVWLDLAYFDWHPKTAEGLNVYGGKMPRPFYRVGDNQLIWDDDVNPEGIAAKYIIPLTERDKLYINGGGLWLKEDTFNSSTGAVNGGAGLWAAQTYLKHDFENKDYLLGGASLYAFSGLDNKVTLFDNTKGFGNTVSTVGGKTYYTMDYDVLEAFGEYGFKVSDMPTCLYGNYIKNTSANTPDDSGWLAGITFNKAKDAGSWEIGYNYRRIEKDATLAVLADSDFNGGGTDGKGHTFCGKYQLTKNIQAALTYFLSKKISNGDDYNRLMADVVFKF